MDSSQIRIFPSIFCRVSLSSLLLVFACSFSFAQAVFVDSIFIQGNKRTRENIITRELDFRSGDTLSLSGLPKRLEKNELLLLNTGLFNDVMINIRDLNSDSVKIHITVRETWYIFPLLIFELADRNFNVWWVEQNRALNRINFGVRFYYENFTGRNDRLKVVTQFGYTQKYELEYRLPWFNRSQSLGLSFNVLHTRNREVAFQTNDSTNRQDFLRLDDGLVLKRNRAGLKIHLRKALFDSHEFGFNFHHNRIADTLATLNPKFFLDGADLQRYFSLEYSFILDRRDRRAYALKGNYFKFQLLKDGLGIFDDVNNLSLSGTYGQYWQAGKKWSFETVLRARKNLLTREQPYFNLRRALGFDEDFVRGYEFYVIDGQDFAYLKTSIRFELFHTEINGSRVIPLRAMKLIPFRLYLKLNNDFGFVNDPFATSGQPLNNILLWGGGPGLDMVIYHSYVFRLEYSFNRLWEKGLYLHFNVPF